jgi:heptosyltransferase-2
MAEPKRILLVKLADLGDLLTATPALRALRLRYPAGEITALVTPHAAELLRENDAVDRILTFPKALFDDPLALLRPGALRAGLQRGLGLARTLHQARFDAVVLLHHLYTRAGRAKYAALLAATGAPVRVGIGDAAFLTHSTPDAGFGARHEVDYWLEVAGLLGARNPCPRLELFLEPGELAAGARRWQAVDRTDRPRVVIHPGSGRFSLARRWPAERFAEVADALVEQGLAVAVVAGPGEEALAERVRAAMSAPAGLLAGIPGPRALAATIQGARLFVGNDSGVMHLAAAVGVPCVGVFGLTNHHAWGPYPPEHHRTVRLELACSPCLYSAFQLGTPQGCAARTCLMELPAQAVIAAARELLTGTSRR